MKGTGENHERKTSMHLVMIGDQVVNLALMIGADLDPPSYQTGPAVRITFAVLGGGEDGTEPWQEVFFGDEAEVLRAYIKGLSKDARKYRDGLGE
jgi:hypothetical protein